MSGLLARNGLVFGIGGFEPPQPTLQLRKLLGTPYVMPSHGENAKRSHRHALAGVDDCRVSATSRRAYYVLTSLRHRLPS
jgi:hypothetical protein